MIGHVVGDRAAIAGVEILQQAYLTRRNGFGIRCVGWKKPILLQRYQPTRDRGFFDVKRTLARIVDLHLKARLTDFSTPFSTRYGHPVEFGADPHLGFQAWRDSLFKPNPCPSTCYG